MKITANGIEMHYEMQGEGKNLVLIHGYSDNLNMWYNQVPEFSKHSQVLSYDVRGFGKSEIGKGPYSMELYADDLYVLLKAFNMESACLLGYSMGGAIGLTFTLKHPDMVRGLVFANSGVGGEPTPEMEQAREMMLEVLKQGDIETIAEMMAVASFSPDFKEKDPEIFRKYKEIKMQNDPSPYVSIMEALFAAIENPPDLSQIECPALIIAGESDAFMPLDVAQSMKNAIRHAVLKVMPTGHAAAIEAPEEFNAIVVEFLKGL